MKYSSLEAFTKHLTASAPDKFARCYLILAKDGFEQKEAADGVVKALREGLSLQEAPLAFDGGQCSQAELFAELNAIPFFGSQQLVIFRDLDKASADLHKALVDYCANPNPHIYLLMQAASLAANTKLYKSAEKHGVVLSMAELRQWEKEKAIEAWILQQGAVLGKKIDPRAAQLLAQQLGVDKRLLAGELEKAACYVGDRPKIEAEDVATVCACENLENIWQLGDYILQRQAAQAVRLVRELLCGGMAFLTLLWQLRGQLQTAYQICSIMDAGGGTGEVAYHFPYLRGRILENKVRLAQAYGQGRFKHGMLLLHKADLQAKNSSVPLEALAETLITRLAR